MNLAKKINLKDDEIVITVIRQHGVFKFTAYTFALLILMTVAFFMFWLLEQGIVGVVIIILGSLLALYLAGRAWLKDCHNFVVLTDVRLVDVVRTGLFHELVSAVKYDNIKDIYIKKSGLGASLFNYGTVAIEIESDKSLLELEKVHRPLRVQDIIEDCQDKNAGQGLLRDKKGVCEAFVKLIPEIDEEELCEVKDFIEAQLVKFDEDVDDLGQDEGQTSG